ncbi:hypothetical protein J3U11_11225 [Gilliamella sp. B2840]|uniref:hypothetical protein n=1 Tax=unclassified Gilliamella TaxID=2685620 RepID=UPI00226AB5DE|nr:MULTISPECIES: hypothetical protein [unclassified Gilliamella]MCX8665976.1 hypothetical protein [Gilliamella sp. B2887]MCX8698300.1 hypothetical protein [Gilliamella sp. B3000]MCX8701645.1 hypothetical protein [Gilliamella sp. B2840]
MTTNEKLLNEIIYHYVILQSYVSHLIQKSTSLINKSNRELMAKLYIVLDEMSHTNFQIKTLKSKLQADIEITGLIQLINDELSKFSEYEYSYRLELLERLLPPNVISKYKLQNIKSELLLSLIFNKPFQGMTLLDWLKKLEQDRINRVVNAIRNSYAQGDSNEQTLAKIKGTKDKNYRDSVLAVVAVNAASIIKTAISNTSTTVQSVFAQKNDKIIKCKQWVSVLDNRTTPTCMIRDSLLYTLDNEPIRHNVPYGDGPGRIHFCCRSIETLVIRSFDEMGIIINDEDVTRDSMEGQVPAKTSYLEWLKKQSHERQEQILGVERARMLRDGEITVDQFFTRDGHFLTLDELRRIH